MKETEVIPLSVPNIRGNERKYIKECLNTNWVSCAGGFIQRFEQAICKYTKARYAVACINGTSGLFIALKLSGVTAGDEVVVPTLTFIAPCNTIRYLGAEPVFIDCDDYMNLDPGKLEEFCRKECRITKNGLKNKKSGRIIRAVIPVHIFGNPCDMAGIMKTAGKYGLKVIEDATESLGAYYTKGAYKNRFTGTIGDLGVYSFNGNKIVTTGGGGMVVADSEKIAEKARYLVAQAKDDPIRYIHNEVGYNLRMTNLQAALGVAQLEKLSSFIEIKKKNYLLYQSCLQGIGGIRVLQPPKGTRSNYWLNCIFVNKAKYGMDTEELMQKLKQQGIQTRPLWYLNHLQKPYLRNYAYKIEKALWFWKNGLSIPSGSNLAWRQIKKVVFCIKALQKDKDRS